MRKIPLTIPAVLIATTVAFAAAAHSGAAGIVKTRMDAMGALSKRMKSLGGMMRGKTDFDPDEAHEIAIAISEHARRIPGHFPEGSIEGPSEALPEIWADWERFEALALQLSDGASTFAAAARRAESANDLSAQFARMAQSCRRCHESFRLAK
ncbi:MAG: cytochrome c [Rhizobiaceae bacterium]